MMRRLLIGLVLACAPVSAEAVSYRYESSLLTGSVLFDAPLPGNLARQSCDHLPGFRGGDLSAPGQPPAGYLLAFECATGPAGDLVRWDLIWSAAGPDYSPPWFVTMATDHGDSFALNARNPSEESIYVEAPAGTWTFIPEPAPVVGLVLGLIGLGVLGKVLRGLDGQGGRH